MGAEADRKEHPAEAAFPGAKTYDFLLSAEYQRLLRNPGILREECQADETQRERNAPPVIIDEVQKIPALLDEVHWLIENLGIRFVLCGSSARKVKRGQANLLGGRAVRYELYPLVYPEVQDMVTDRHLKGLRAFREDYRARHLIAVSMDPKPRKTSGGIDILPWEEFLRRLWGNKIL
ncbi:MAG: AAA family ATPase [Desulfobacterales bacterium]